MMDDDTHCGHASNQQNNENMNEAMVLALKKLQFDMNALRLRNETLMAKLGSAIQ